jgi:hypothetical protein
MTTTVNSEPRKDNAFLAWRPIEIAQARVAELQEENPELDSDDAFLAAMADEQLFINEWDYLLEALTDLMQRINPAGDWSAEVKQFGWREQSGTKSFHADDGKQFLREILPDTECSFKIFVEGEGDKQVISINNPHHDVPIWGKEWYYIRPA